MKQLFSIGERYHGQGKVLFAWQPAGNFLATSGANGLVHIFDRKGEQVAEVELPVAAQCIGLDWDAEGECVAVLQEGSERVAIWELSTRSTTIVETPLKDPTFLKWAKAGPQLAIGNAKGNLLIYRKDNRKKIPIMGKHSKRIICGAWSADNKLALGGADSMLTLSNAEGDTIDQTELKYEPVSMQFAAQKTDGRTRGNAPKPETTVSVNMDGKTILLYNIEDPDNPIELAFQPRYGKIVTYTWYGDGYMVIGFSEGYVVVISTHMQEIGEEQFSGRFHKDRLDGFALSNAAQRAVTCGGNVIKLIEMAKWTELKDEVTQVDSSDAPIESVAWTSDGQIVTIATRSRKVISFLARMPTITDAYLTRVAYMSSLRELCVLDTLNTGERVIVPVTIEPEFVALGPSHVAVGMNNSVWYHRYDADRHEVVNQREYVSTVDCLRFGREHVAVLSGGKVQVHLIENSGAYGDGDQDVKILPDREDGAQATCVTVTNDFVIVGTDTGSIEYFYFGEWTSLPGSELRHSHGIKSVFANATGTRVLFIDDESRGFLYNPVNSLLLQIPDDNMPKDVRQVMWDAADWGLFVLCNAAEMHTYIHCPLTINGAIITELGSLTVRPDGDTIIEPVATPIPSGYTPISVYNGVVTCQLGNGSLATIDLVSHDVLSKSGPLTPERLRVAFGQNLALLRLQDAWTCALQLNDDSVFSALANKAMEVLDVDMAVRVYRRLGDAGMVLALEQLRFVEDKNLLAGKICLLFNDFLLAQELFLASSQPLAALEMRKDLMQWDQALKLAQTLDPSQVPALSVEYAKQLEFKGENGQSLSMYQSAMASLDALAREGAPAEQIAALRNSCLAGLARTTLRSGDLRRGVQLANESNDKTLCRECAGILETMKQYNEAATLYKRAEAYDRAASILIKTKNLAALEPIMQQITQPKILQQYAKAKEATRDFKAAVDAYRKARDHDNVVRVLLDHLSQPEAASEIVRKTGSADGARKVSRYCESVGDFRGAIEFLLLARDTADAFDLAQNHNEMSTYARLVGDDAKSEEYQRIAEYFERRDHLHEAGRFYVKCGDYRKAIHLFLRVGESALEDAIEVVAKANNDMLTAMVSDYLAGEDDGQAKDAMYTLKMYFALGKYKHAADTAITIAKSEQELGNYRDAHRILFETHRRLQEAGSPVSRTLSRMLMLLHSYVLVKKLVKKNDHAGAARMLLRVAKNISRFPTHVVPILTSTVIECQRAGLKATALEYASMLMRPEYRSKIDPKLKRKIEMLVRRPSREEAEEEATPCPNCDSPVPATILECHVCRAHIPYCIITGRHMVADDWAMSPSSGFPALHSALVAHVGEGEPDPMSGEVITAADIKLETDPKAVLARWNGQQSEDEAQSAAAEE